MISLTFALVGNPNCGKTTLFNALTGSHQKVGNWPGVTVERKVGFFKTADNQKAELIDLPGVYSLEQNDYGIDEEIAKNFITTHKIDLIINVVDASSLDRQLLLTHQLRDFNVPVLVVVNMLDVAQANNVELNLEALAELIGFPVVGIVASKSSSIQKVHSEIPNALYRNANATKFTNVGMPKKEDERIYARLNEVRAWVGQCVQTPENHLSLSEKIDRVVLHKYLGIPIFLLAMYLLFTFAINVGAIFIDFFDILLGAWLVEGTWQLLNAMNAPQWFGVLLANGLGSGIQLVGTFIPVIGFLYLGLAVLEGSGYIVRAAFVVDRLMQSIGLPGKAFVPLIVGFGCNVPSIMATRTLDRQSDRMITIAMSPFMSCGARLTVYALFAAAFFGNSGQNIVFALYLLGISMAVLTGWLFRKAFYSGELGTSIMEMPVYHIPTLRNVLITTWHRLKGFIARAGKTIIIVVTVISFLNSWGTDGSFGNENSQNSVLSELSRKITPVFSPLGIQQDNWPATVGVITGIFAKEAVVGTLDSLYSDSVDHGDENTTTFSLINETTLAFKSIVSNSLELADALTDPLGIKVDSSLSLNDAAEKQGVRQSTFASMAELFVTPFAAFCYLVFILLYTPCVAVMGALVREAGGKWSWVVISWSSVLAYSAATILFQFGTLLLHPISSTLWIISMFALLTVYIKLISRFGHPDKNNSLNLISVKQI